MLVQQNGFKMKHQALRKPAIWESKEQQRSRVMGFAHMHKHDRKSPLPHTEMRFTLGVNETTMQQRADNH